MDRNGVARQIWRLLEPVHAVTYFSPEPLAELQSAGYRGFWMGYFAGRAAPLGAAPADLVHAVFYNFRYDHVARALPDAWDFAPPSRALEARRAGSVAALRRLLGSLADAPAVRRAAEIAAEAARRAPLEGRPLFAANHTLAEPDEPLELLWHAATLLREHRGDGHVAVLTANGVDGREAHVLHSLATSTPPSVSAAARQFGEEEWATVTAVLTERGWAEVDGTITEAGRHVKHVVEDRTDELAASAYDHLDTAAVQEFLAALRPLAAAVAGAGEIPRKSPMGLDLDESFA